MKPCPLGYDQNNILPVNIAHCSFTAESLTLVTDAPQLARHAKSDRVYPEAPRRHSHCSAVVEGRWYNYAGIPKTSRNSIHVFDPVSETWQQFSTHGTPPPGFMYKACTAIGSNMYTFAGSYTTYIHQLDVRTLIWTELKPVNAKEAPMDKYDATMVSYAETVLVTFAGRGFVPEYLRPGVDYVLNPDDEDECVSNELCCFEINSSESCLSAITVYNMRNNSCHDIQSQTD